MFTPSTIIFQSIISLSCIVHWCDPAMLNNEDAASSGNNSAHSAGTDGSVSDGRVLVLDEMQNMLMPANYNASLYFDELNMLLAHLPFIKFGILGSVMALLIPSLHIILILSLIAFSITGTAVVLCSAFDCGEFFGFGHQQSNNHRPYAAYGSNFLKKNFRTTNLNGVQPYHSYNYPSNANTNHWNSFDMTQNMLDTAYDKFEE